MLRPPYNGPLKGPTTTSNTSTLQPTLARAREATRDSLHATLKLGQRVFSVGHTGTGKTWLMMRLIEESVPPRLPVVVIDPKGLLEVNAGSDWEIVDDLPRHWERLIRNRKRPRHLRLIVRPDFYEDMRRNETLNSVYARIFAAQKCLVYLDEIQALCYNSRASSALARLVQQGRQPKISVWGSTLRPSGIPKMFITETDHSFTFYLQDEQDRDRMGEVIGPRGKEIPGPGKHDFWYRPPWDGVIDPILVHQ